MHCEPPSPNNGTVDCTGYLFDTRSSSFHVITTHRRRARRRAQWPWWRAGRTRGWRRPYPGLGRRGTCERGVAPDPGLARERQQRAPPRMSRSAGTDAVPYRMPHASSASRAASPSPPCISQVRRHQEVAVPARKPRPSRTPRQRSRGSRRAAVEAGEAQSAAAPTARNRSCSWLACCYRFRTSD